MHRLFRFLVLPVLLGTSPIVAGAEFHVSFSGLDSAAGTADAPFATLTRARDAIRELRKKAALKEPGRVVVHDGIYEMQQPLELDVVDGRSDGQPVTWEAAPGATPKFIGARKVSGWTAHEGNILKADVASLNLSKLQIRQLLLDGERQPLARYPNFDPANPLYGGWAFLTELPEGANEGHVWKREGYVKEADVRKWSRPEEVELFIFAQYGWWNFIEPVKSLDQVTRKLTLAKDCGYDLHPHNRYFFQNALEELDAPGEWYLDQKSATLYFWPPKALDKAEVRIPVVESFIRMRAGVKGITVRGLSFLGCNGTAVTMEGTEDCLVTKCVIEHCGTMRGSGVSLQGGKNNRVERNEISYIGNTGVGVGGGDRKTLVPANNVVTNNHIHHVGVINKNAAGVGLGGVGNVVTHNLIHDGPRMGVQFSGNNLVIEYNHIHHVMLETQDGGGVYTGGRDWISSRGTSLKYNFIHDIVGVGQESAGLKVPFFAWGIYMDDNAGGLDIVGNIVARCSRAAIHLHNGRDHHILNNIFVDGGERQIEFNGWRPEHSYVKNHMTTMVEGWASVKDLPAWKGMRGMDIDPRNAFFPDQTMMSGNVTERNIVLWSKPELRYVDARNCMPEHNTCDYNLAWNGGQPIRTAVSKVGPDEGDDLLAGAGSFQGVTDGTAPKGWGWNHKPLKELKSVVQGGVLVTDGAVSKDPKNPHSVIHSPFVPFKAGASFRARLKVRSNKPEAKVSAAFMMFVGGKGYWEGPRKEIHLTPEWQEVEVTGSMPRETDAKWKDWMRQFCVRFDFPVDQAVLELKDLSIREAGPMDEWSAWQSEGWDKHSVVADPLFEDASKDDYRLKPKSPAFKLGFKALPIEKIGVVAEGEGKN
ncbi:right-handed parallel beta-helix repeat-containing protein [Verrucomicrobium sp. BvORR034]|uniref:right-handed parallel beta-helix repeat-containing protein n=1 Tax=Verrucomicrobium sp. BvORR034 TaxID=1396418 RepID=UPI000678DD8D|nr:right-handed parallel beta-helix repeat-containing protein [Verrucomicrobium sp. BvORR034]